MKIAIAICSANYLPFAKSLGDSLLKHNPDYTFITVLLDEYEIADPGFFHPHRIVPVSQMGIADFEEMNSKYDIFELSCALKPFAIEYFFNTEPEGNIIVYLDCDILVYGSLEECETALQKNSVVLTPHINSPLEHPSLFPNEQVLLKAGIYNAGFFAVRRSEISFSFLDWWQSRLKDLCYNDASNGLFVDQIWLSWVPLFFKNIYLLTNPGYNVAYWNLHERNIKETEKGFVVNDSHPLVFYHFSGFDIDAPILISKHQNRYSFDVKQELKPLYAQYVESAYKNKYEEYKGIAPFYGTPKLVIVEPAKKKKIFSTVPIQNFFKRLIGTKQVEV